MKYTLKKLKSKGSRPYVIYQNRKAHKNYSNKREAERVLKRLIKVAGKI